MSLKYRIASIGWYNFETLVQTLLKGVIGSGVTSFGGTKDGGRDAAFNGTANFPSEETQWSGFWVFQVKYIDFEQQGIRAARTQLKNALKKECEQILTRRRREQPPDNYVLITDVPLTARNRDDVEAIALGSSFPGKFRVIDGREVCEYLDLFPQVRRSYPQLLGLADLQRVVNRELYVRSEAYVQQWQPRLATFVRTSPYEEALTTLGHHRFAVLDGPPEAGKSTIAAAVAILQAAEGFEVVDLRSPEEFFKVYAADHPQLYVADDAVGSVSFNPSLTDSWSRELPGILRKLDKEHLLVWTARSYVLEEAIAESKLGEAIDNFPGAHEVLVEVGKLSLLEKAEILYNHARQASLSEASRSLIRQHAREIADHPNFTPERIRQLVQNVLPRDTDSDQGRSASVNWADVERFLKNPGKRWLRAYRQLGASEQMLLLALLGFNFGGSVDDVRRAYKNSCGHVDDTGLGFDECVNRLEHSFIRVTKSYSGDKHINFQHPSLRDMLVSQLRGNELARRRFIALASPVSVANLIQGLARSSSGEPKRDHLLVPKGDAELRTLVARLRELSDGVLRFSEWHGILSAAELLLPRDASRRRVPPSEAQLAEFARSRQGRVVAAVVAAFGRQATYDRSQRYDVGQWSILLRRYFDLAVFVEPPPRPDFLSELVKRVPTSDPEDGIAFACLLQECDPLLVRQALSGDLLDRWDSHIRDRAEELTAIGESVTDWHEQVLHIDWVSRTGASVSVTLTGYDYDVWDGEVDDLMTLAARFYGWAQLQVPELLSDLEELVNAVEPPPEPDWDAVYDLAPAPQVDYWTIETMFEDL